MSANFLNLHIQEGEPLGSDAEYVEIAEYYADQYLQLRAEVERLSKTDLKSAYGELQVYKRGMLDAAETLIAPHDKGSLKYYEAKYFADIIKAKAEEVGK